MPVSNFVAEFRVRVSTVHARAASPFSYGHPKASPNIAPTLT